MLSLPNRPPLTTPRAPEPLPNTFSPQLPSTSPGTHGPDPSASPPHTSQPYKREEAGKEMEGHRGANRSTRSTSCCELDKPAGCHLDTNPESRGHVSIGNGGQRWKPKCFGFFLPHHSQYTVALPTSLDMGLVRGAWNPTWVRWSGAA